MKTVIVIPSRYQSTRLPGKPLLDIGGEAMVVLSVDSPVDEAILAELSDAIGARYAKAVHLS